MKKSIKAVALAAILSAIAGNAKTADLENTIYLDLKDGRVVIELRPDLAPKTVARMKELTRQHFFDGIVFHRVISGFMAQTGDPKGTGFGGSGQNLPAEFSSARHVRGTVSMPRHPSLTANIRSGAKWFRAWNSSTRSRPATTIPTAWLSHRRIRSSACRSPRTPSPKLVFAGLVAGVSHRGGPRPLWRCAPRDRGTAR